MAGGVEIMGLAAALKGASLVAGVVGAISSSRASKKAARTQAESAEAGIAEQRAARQQAIGALQPFRQAGEAALDPLQQFVLEGPETEFERTQGFEAIQKSAAAGRKLQSGQTLKALTEFSAGVNQRFRTQRFNELLQLANLGQTSAAGAANIGIRTGENVSSLLVGRGNVRAAGTVGAASALSTGITQFGSFLGSLKPQTPEPLAAGVG